LGCGEADIEDAATDIRRRDAERLSEQVHGDIMSGSNRLLLQPVRKPLL
jgi:glutathione-regulated potassium-efflux system protein KefB